MIGGALTSATGGAGRATPGEDQASQLRRLVASLERGERGGAEGPRAATAPTIAIASGKGGVGKTNLSVNLAIALARRGLRVTLLDADLGLANADVLCGLRVHGNLGHVLDGERTLREILVRAPGGFTLVPGAAGLVDLASLPASRLESLVSELAGLDEESDALIVDCGAGLGRDVLAFLALADLPVVVATPEPTSIADAYALIKASMRERAGRREGSIRLIVNQASDASEAERVRARISSVTARFLGIETSLLGWAPLDRHVTRAVRARRPLCEAHPSSPAAKAVVRLGAEVRRELDLGGKRKNCRPGLIARLLGLEETGRSGGSRERRSAEGPR